MLYSNHRKSTDYVLSPCTMEKLKIIREKLKEDITQSNPLWQIVAGKSEEATDSEEEILDENNESSNHALQVEEQFSSTQFYFTQLDDHFKKVCQWDSKSNEDITECLFEELECPNGKLDVTQLDILTDTEIVEIVCELQKKLTMLGMYNLCRSMNNMNLEQQIKYAGVFYSHLLLPKIIALQEPSRLLLSAITECVQKFPDEIQKLIFVPLINTDLKDTTIIDAIVNAFEPQRRTTLMMEYLSNVRELQLWHLPFLHNLISIKMDTMMNDKFIQLLSEKALDLAKEKNFGKFVLSFIKVNSRFSEEQKHLLSEIANVNQTLFKKPMQNLLKTI